MIHSSVALTVPTPNFPVIGNNAPIGLLFAAHMAIAQFSLGAITLGPIFEIWGFRARDPRKIRLARAFAKSYYLMFSLGATLGVFAVTALIGLWGNQFGTVVNQFLPLMALAFGIFPPLVVLLLIYQNTFGRIRPRTHCIIGVSLWFLQTLFLVCIAAVDSYLIVPQHSGFADGALNPTYFPLLFHRLVGNVSWTALFAAGVAVFGLGASRTEADIAFRSWAAHILLRIGTATLLIMPPLGALIVVAVHNNQLGFFDNLVRGQTAYFFIIQMAMLSLIFIGANIALALEMPTSGGPLGRLGAAATMLTVVGMAIGTLPGGVLGESIYAVRYVGIAVAVLATLVHLVVRTAPRRERMRLAPAPGAQTVMPFTSSSRARRVVFGVGVLAAFLTLWMGVMKEEARGSYAIYGEMTQDQGHGQFNPPGLYP